MITASKIKKLKKDKTKLIRTVAIAADKLSDKKRERGRREGLIAMVAALRLINHFGQERLNRVLAYANVVLENMDISPEVFETMTKAWEEKGVKV